MLLLARATRSAITMLQTAHVHSRAISAASMILAPRISSARSHVSFASHHRLSLLRTAPTRSTASGRSVKLNPLPSFSRHFSGESRREMRLVQLAAAQGDVASTSDGGAGKGGEEKQSVNESIDHEVAVLMEEDLKIGHAEQVGRFVMEGCWGCMSECFN